MTQTTAVKKKKLEIILSQIAWPMELKPSLEQYMTPATIAADILFIAYSRGDISDKRVIDLGSGSGIFTIGCAITGANEVIGLDIDRKMCVTARKNASEIIPDNNEVRCEFIQCDVATIPLKCEFDTCIMNPPFGSQRRHSDRPFIASAVSIARNIYSLHNAVTTEFVLEYYTRLGAYAEVLENYIFPIPYMFPFHKKEYMMIETVLIYATVDKW